MDFELKSVIKGSASETDNWNFKHFFRLKKSLFRCANISWIHVGESVSHSVINVLRILSNLGHIFRLSPVYAQGMFRVGSE